MHASLCICALIPTLQTRTRIVLVMHRAEERKSTNTGRLALAALPNSQIVVRGRRGAPADDLAWGARSRPLLLFPHEDAAPIGTALESLAQASDDRPFTLVVPDGNWRQASKVRKRVAGLNDVPCVSLPIGERSIYRLRFEAHRTGLATLEAIARALRILEGDGGPEIERALLELFRVMVDRTLWSRGSIAARDVAGGVPPGVRRDVPRARESSTSALPVPPDLTHPRAEV
jgi:DTW domain-containing protein YfiP